MLQKTDHVNHQINVSIDEKFQYFQNANVVKMVGYKRVAPSVPILSKSRVTNEKLLPNDRSTNTFQVVHHCTETFQICSITFQLAVPKLSK